MLSVDKQLEIIKRGVVEIVPEEELVAKLNRSVKTGEPNYIGIDESPREMYGKTMSIPDELMLRYFELVTMLPLDEVKKIAVGMQNNELHPRDIKMRLAREIVGIYHGKEAALQAEDEFKRVFQQHDLPEEIPVFNIINDILEDGMVWLPKLMHQSGMCASTSEAKRLIQQGAVRVDGERFSDPNQKIQPAQGMIIKAGKRKFIRIML